MIEMKKNCWHIGGRKTMENRFHRLYMERWKRSMYKRLFIYLLYHAYICMHDIINKLSLENA